MNIIKQLIDSDGNNIYPIAYAQGGSKWELLWTNDQPSSTRGAFDITINNTYDLYMVEYISAATDGIAVSTCNTLPFILNGIKKQMLFINTYGTRFQRAFTPYANGTISFEQGYGGGTANSNYAVPEFIYGLKCSWIVPTTVQGLQYIEV